MAKKGGAQPGNQFAKKLTTKEKRLEAFRQYCEHLASGMPKEAWCYEDPDDPLMSLTSKTMEKYIKDYAHELPAILREVAETKSYSYWFKEGKRMITGENSRGSPVTWQCVMRNMFLWDRDNQITHTFQPDCVKIFEKWNKKT